MSIASDISAWLPVAWFGPSNRRGNAFVEGRAGRFDAKDMRHHHFIRDRCGDVEDIEWYDVLRPASGSFDKRVFREREVIFWGSARSAFRGTLPVKCRRRVDNG
jgi:hypothetical protein